MTTRGRKVEVWMPHAGHFICGYKCQFRLNTYVNGYIVSTVGEYVPSDWGNKSGFDTIGCDRLYETMVFKAIKSSHKCCPYKQATGSNIDFAGYNKPEAAYKGHLKMLAKYRRRAR